MLIIQGRIVNVEDDDILKLDRSFQQVGDDLGGITKELKTQVEHKYKEMELQVMLQNLLVILKLNIVLMMKKN